MVVAGLNVPHRACQLRTRARRRRCVDHLLTVLSIRGRMGSPNQLSLHGSSGSDSGLTRGNRMSAVMAGVAALQVLDGALDASRDPAVPDRFDEPSGVPAAKYRRPLWHTTVCQGYSS